VGTVTTLDTPDAVSSSWDIAEPFDPSRSASKPADADMLARLASKIPVATSKHTLTS
jgi:hypothetical protein